MPLFKSVLISDVKMPSNLTAETSEGDRYYTCGDYKQAIVSYTQLIDKNSHEKDTKIDQLGWHWCKCEFNKIFDFLLKKFYC